jgi:hypothetical protein
VPAAITYASALSQIALGREAQAGTAVTPTTLLPVDKADLSDEITKVEDKAWRGSMVDVYNIAPGPIHSALTFSGPVLADSFPYLLSNILGDNVYTGAPTGTGATTLSAPVTVVGANSVLATAAVTPGAVIQIDTGAASEVRTVTTTSGTAPNVTVNLNAPLNNLHASGVALVPVATPFTVLQALLNSGGVSGQAQPSTLTIVDQNWVTAATGARAYPGVCLEELTITADPGSLFHFDAKAQGFPSAPAAAGVGQLASSPVQPNAGWKATTSIGGTPVVNVESFQIMIKRSLEVVNTVDGTQAPLTIRRGTVDVSGKMTIVAADEGPLLTYLTQNNVPLALAMDNGLTGAAQLHTQFDVAAARYVSPTKINRGKESVSFDVAWASIPASSTAGASGGLSPVRATSINAVPANSY